MKFLFLGAGVVGGTVGAWVAEHYDDVYFLDQGPVAEAMKKNGITTYLGDDPAKKVNVKVKLIDSLDEAGDIDVICLGVKNYSLEPVAKAIKEKLGDKPIIISMANGIDNQRVLPKIFSKVVYCVISYNGWLDEPGLIGYQKKGPIIIGTLKGELRGEMKEISDIFNKGVETVVTDHIQDAIHSKIVINLTNSVTTLLGPDFQKEPNRKLLQVLLSGTLYEGIEILKAAGYKECKLGGMPSWGLLWASWKLPRLITGPLFEKNVKKMVMSSMAQDVFKHGDGNTELNSINGYIVELADKVNHKAPFNRAMYELCKREFVKPDFKSVPIEDIWREVQSRM